MAEQWPKITSRQTVVVSPWMDIVARKIEFMPGESPQVYHAVRQPDYLAIVARTPDGRIPMVRQFRPALETFTWELPAGLLDSGEDPAQGCQRELLEETGFPARSVHNLGTAAPCTGRLSNHIHSYFIETGERVADFTPEPGVMVDLKSPTELVAMIHAGTFDSQLHLGALLLAELKGLLKLPR